MYHLSNCYLQVFLLLVKRLASLHYNHTELPQDSDLKSSVSLAEGNNKSSTRSCSQAINNCRAKRDSNTNPISKTFGADYDEVDFQSTSEGNYIERINETINKSSRTQQNMGSNVSTAGGKGLSGRRTQSSSECHATVKFLLSGIEFFMLDRKPEKFECENLNQI